jgi:glycosyltransferase XagB
VTDHRDTDPTVPGADPSRRGGLRLVTGDDASALSARLGPRGRIPRLGEELISRGLASREVISVTLEQAERTGARLGELLVARGVIRRLDLYRVLSDAWGVPFIDLVQVPPDNDLTSQLGLDPEALAAATWLPVGAARGVLLCATSEQPDAALEQAVRDATGWAGAIVFHATTEWDLRAAVLRGHGAELTRRAASSLAERSPEESAARVLTTRQAVVLAAAALATIGGYVAAPASAVFVTLLVLNACFASNVAFKATAAFVGAARAGRRARRQAAADAPFADRDLPTYTVLVPAFGEANVIGDLVRHLADLDYPTDRLQVLLLLEEVDRPTIDAALAASMPGFVRIVVVPDGQPRTKPKACNVGLGFATGEFLVIYDAEDRPEHDQLRRAVAAFRAAPDEVICVQARLNYHNADENLLTRLFTLEYSQWFDLMLEGLSAFRLPIPLGGTSNHFRTAPLRALGAWDPHNVTEDADLGLRAAARGYRVVTLASTTYEEACCRVWPWIRQRTRWIKGYMQSALVHTRHPLRFAHAAGPHATLTLVFLIAATPLAFLCAPILWAFLIVGLVTGHPPAISTHGGFLTTLEVVNLLVGNLLMIMISVLAAARRRRYALAAYSLVLPAYWVLHSIAAWRAAWQLLTAPSHWEKTPHGLSTHAAAPSPAAARALADEVAAALRKPA